MWRWLTVWNGGYSDPRLSSTANMETWFAVDVFAHAWFPFRVRCCIESASGIALNDRLEPIFMGKLMNRKMPEFLLFVAVWGTPRLLLKFLHLHQNRCLWFELNDRLQSQKFREVWASKSMWYSEVQTQIFGDSGCTWRIEILGTLHAQNFCRSMNGLIFLYRLASCRVRMMDSSPPFPIP